MWVQQLAEALEAVSVAAAPLVGPAWREVPAFTLVFGAIFFAALPFWVRSQLVVAGGFCAAHPCLQLLLLCSFPRRTVCALCMQLHSPAACSSSPPPLPRLPFTQRYVVGVNWKKAAILSSCSMSSVHGLLSALGALRLLHVLRCSSPVCGADGGHSGDVLPRQKAVQV